jgi:SAM-dependent methyltransferase
MHSSSYDRMAEFCRDYLAARRQEALTIVDLGSCDYNGSYHPIFAQRPWRYIGVDLTPGKNVDLVLRDPYDWQELKTESVDVLVSGQTFEHTEFFWETILEIARVLKPNGLCCIIAPATGNEHRFPLDCWRIFADGFRALARYARLEVLHSHTHWEELARYDSESNKWHESVLIARKRPRSLGEKVRERLFATARRRLHPLPQKIEALVQVFYTNDGVHREEASVIAGVEQGTWQEIAVTLPSGAGARPLRIDFMRSLDLIEIAKVSVSAGAQEYFFAATADQFKTIAVEGDAERLPHSQYLRLRITGIDPQLVLPVLETNPDEGKPRVELRLRVFSER